MKKILEAFFIILIFLGLMKLVDILLNAFVHEIVIQNILAIVAALISLILSTWLSERIVMLIKRYL